MLGKRKREVNVVSRSKIDSEDSKFQGSATTDLTDIFRQYFEARFAPLPNQHVDVGAGEGDEDSEENNAGSETESNASEWSGISTTEEPVTVIEVVDHASRTVAEDDEIHRARQKAFMVR